ncbi:MAG: ABC transporter ATP-binding protein [Bacilli bacterium]
MKKTVLIIKKYFKVIKPNKKITIFLFGSALLSQIFSLIAPLAFGKIIKFVTSKDYKLSFIFLGLYFILFLLSHLLNGFNFKSYGLYYENVYSKVQLSIINCLQKLHISYFNGENKGKLVSIVNEDAESLSYFGDYLTESVVSIISLVVVICIIFSINFYIGIIIVIVNVFNLFIMNKYNDQGEKIIKVKKEIRDDMTGFFTGIISGIGEIKIFNIMSKIEENYKEKNTRFTGKFKELMRNRILRNIIIPIINLIMEICIIFYLILLIIKGSLGIETIVVLVTYFNMISSNTRYIMIVSEQIRVINVALNRFIDVINYHTIDDVIFGNINETNISGSIVFDHVNFSYDKDNEVLNDVSFVIPNNKITMIVGVSGSGKSTIFNLLSRFYSPKSGTITMDNINIYDFNKEIYSNNLSIVKQQPFLFNMTINDNLLLINDNKKEIVKACDKVHLSDYINSLPRKYNTLINEDATDLSGGQKQRLAIARTLLKKSEIILLDEVTSSLDSNLSNEIYSLLEELKVNHTIIAISHKLEEMKKADNIIVLDHGRVVGTGLHKDLIKSNSYYKKICQKDV